MTDSVDRHAGPTRIGELVYLLPRTDRDGGDLRRENSSSDESFSNATPAGGDKPSADNHHGHTHVEHVYVVYWPDASILKIGISSRARWEKWLGTGVEIASLPCGSSAPRIERELLGILAHWGAPAFTSAEQAHRVLGIRGGFTECYRLVPSRRWQQPLRECLDGKRWDEIIELEYGLNVPDALMDRMVELQFFWRDIKCPIDEDESGSSGSPAVGAK